MGLLATCYVLGMWATLVPSTAHDYEALVAQLERWSAQAAIDSAEVETWWQALSGELPFREGERVLFLFREQPERPVASVAWLGDFNDWKPTAEFMGRKVGNSGLWYLTCRFQRDARLDYKLVLDGSEWITDPANARSQLGGYGPNSVLAMPDYVEESLLRLQPGTQSGQLVEGKIHAHLLGYDVAYRVYLPFGYEQISDLPSLYVMDGHEYAHPEMGGMTTVLDNLIGQGRIPPLVVVFVDPRDPKNEDNRRMDEYGNHYAVYSRFLCDELVPAIDGAYKTSKLPTRRGVMGTSLGGLFSAYTLLAHHHCFRLAGIHSPAFGFDARQSNCLRFDGPVLRLWQGAHQLDGRAYILTGTVGDVQDVALRFSDLARAHGIEVAYREVHEGHSWGNWRTHIDDTLLHLFGSN